MSGGGLGNLTVFLGLDAVQFTTGMDKAKKQAYDFGYAIGTGIRKSAEVAAAALTALGAAGAGALVVLNRQANNIAAYQDLADKIGDTASRVTSLQLAADLSGVALDTVAASSVKLTAGLAKGGDEAKKIESGLKAIGIQVKEFKQLSPVEQIDKVAKSLAEYENGAQKTAVAVALFGESGANLIPFLNDQAEAQSNAIRLTDEQISRADEFTKEIARQKSELSAMVQVVVAESLPAVSALIGAFKDAARETLGLSNGATDLKNNTSIREFANDAAVFLAQIVDMTKAVGFGFEYVGKTIGATAAIAAAAKRGEFGAIGDIIDAARQSGQDMLKSWNAPSLADRVRERIAAQAAAGASGGASAPKKTLTYTPPMKGSGAAELLKKQLDNELKILENAYKREDELLRDRNKMLDLVNGENMIAFRDYYAGRRAAAEEALRNQTALLDQEIAKLQAYKAAAAKATEREAAQGKINDLIERKGRLQRDAATEAVVLASQEAKAYDGLQRSLNGVNASILEMLGLSGQAARIRFDDSNKDLRERLQAEGDTTGLQQLSRLRDLTTAQADFNQKQTENSDILTRLQMQEDRINLARNLGAIGELAGLQQATEARRAAVKQMEAQVLALEAIARASDNPKLVLQAEQARAALERLNAESNLVAQRFDTMFSDAGSNAFADWITGAKSAKDAATDLLNSVSSQITRLVAQSAWTSLFGGKGLLGSGGSTGFFGDLFGSLFGGGRAVGGRVSPGKMYEVNENGSELLEQGGRTYLMTGGRGGRIVPNSQAFGGSGGFNQVNNFTVPGGIDRRTQSQIADQTRRSTNTAVARLG
ncbi:hypothetical protein Daci_1643 [Delftia acidovorans SPH-1]|uniref:Bacteriophage tail tape measure C-terminal domain-containing protein n=1 Tax=Delftia acidovorans (strain DSM 14801 / SPH-1) TaxID=398578 RepID=A9BYE7_DELAS|nr:hypothetical protein [Delftia acidovorans]ABX34286.1 hypothetical protein Daci_1643 [Delftia acidovorans SPH-1]QPS76334.1 hypothetical protein I6G48_07225 [Delftia acidovorans]